MRHTLTSLAGLACAAGLAFAIVGTTPAQAAGAAGATNDVRASLSPLVMRGAVENIEEASFRDRRRGYRRSWRDPRLRHRRGGAHFYFHFGPPPRYYIPAPRRHAYHLPAAHIRWCHNRFRSYRAWDNSFQPYRGPRRPCISPYFRAY